MENSTPQHRQPQFKNYLLLAAIFAVACLVAMPFDPILAKAFRERLLPGDFRALVTLSEVFAHGTGATIILVVIWIIAIEHRRKLLRVGLCMAVPGLLASFAKLILGRHRPNSLETLPEHVSETFVGLFPAFTQQATTAGSMFDRTIQSFPSGHSATAVGLAIGLSWLFPRGKWCFVCLAGLAMCQRLDSGAHFLSDTLCSAALASIIAGRYVSSGWESRWLTRFEAEPSEQPEALPMQKAA
jgi:membrane-associated phospholipid phosphatase